MKVGYPDGVKFEKTLKPDPTSEFLPRFYRAVHRVFPDCVTLSQAVAFNMFLAFSPMILVVLGAVAGSAAFRQALEWNSRSAADCVPSGNAHDPQ